MDVYQIAVCFMLLLHILQLVSSALDHMVHGLRKQHQSLISLIAALHLAYGSSRPHILWFGQLVSQHPSVNKDLQGTLPRKGFSGMVF